jgi:fucose permease
MEEGYTPTGEVPRGTLANFLFVGAIISFGIFIPSFIFEKLTLKKGSSEKTNKK